MCCYQWQVYCKKSIICMGLENYKTSIESDRLILRILEENDASEEYAFWLNDPIVNKYLETRKATIEELKKYIKERLESGKCLFFGIFWKADGEHIGNIKLEPVDFEQKKATLGILIGNTAYWGKGVGAEAVNALTDYAFNSLNLNEVNLGVISENKPAVGLYKKCGFEEYDIKKQSLDHEGILYDSVQMRKRKNG